MASTTKSYLMARRASNNYRFLTNDPPIQPGHHSSSSLEFDESDIWGGSTRFESPESRPSPPPPSSRLSRKPMAPPTPIKTRCNGGNAAASLPVSIPDWSKILRQEYNKTDKWSFSGEFDGGNNGGGVGDDDGEEWTAPHEYLARTRMASFSVHEGVGRTLKGRDLSKVRNAIWEKTGFQD